MKVYQVQSQQSSYVSKQNFGVMKISPEAAKSIKDAVKNGLLDQRVDLNSKRVKRALGRLGGELEEIEFCNNPWDNTWEICPLVDYTTSSSPYGEFGLAPTRFAHKPRVKDFISVLEKAYNDAKATFDRWH